MLLPASCNSFRYDARNETKSEKHAHNVTLCLIYEYCAFGCTSGCSRGQPNVYTLHMHNKHTQFFSLPFFARVCARKTRHKRQRSHRLHPSSRAHHTKPCLNIIFNYFHGSLNLCNACNAVLSENGREKKWKVHNELLSAPKHAAREVQTKKCRHSVCIFISLR